MVPNPEYYGKEATKSQIETLERLFDINDDGTLVLGYRKSSQEVLQKVLTFKTDYWHR